MTVCSLLDGRDDEKPEKRNRNVIPEGSRNSTLSRFAARVLKRCGNTGKARNAFDEHAKRCDPPLEPEELESIWNSALKFYSAVRKQDGYVEPDEFGADTVSLRPDDYSDIGQARMLAREYGNELVYTDATDYLRYDGTAWQESGQLAVGAMEEFLDLQLENAEDEVAAAVAVLESMGEDRKDITGGAKKYEDSLSGAALEAYMDYKAAAEYRSFVLKRRDMKYVQSALAAAKPMLAVGIDELDSDGFLLNTPGGTYDLRTGERREHRPADLITKVTSADPSEDGAEIWADALETFFCGDAELVSYVQKVAGLAAVGKIFTEALIIAYGDGRNGKSTFWNSISKVMGSYAGAISADAFTYSCRRNVKPEMAELKGRRLVISSELPEGERLNTAVVKQMCSTDPIYAEKKYKDPFLFTPSHTVVLYTNHLPRVGANDPGIWRRLIVIPFNAVIEGDGDIKNYTDYLVENAGGAILKWIMEGARAAIDAGFKIKMPQCVSDAVDHYRGDNDWLGRFIDECCETGELYEQKSGEFYQEYRNYCQRTGDYTRSALDFINALDKAGFVRKKTRTGIFIIGIRMKIDDFLD